jgi:hydrogenase-4 component F
MPESLVVLLLLTPLLAALACALPGFQAEVQPLSAVAGLLLVGFAVLLVTRTTGAAVHTGLGGVVLVDAVSGVLLLAICAIGSAALASAPAALVPTPSVPVVPTRSRAHAELDGGEASPEFTHSVVHLTLASMLVTLIAANLIVLWLGLALSTALAIWLAGDASNGRVEAEVRRIVISGAGLALALAAIVVLALAATPRLGYALTALDWPTLRTMHPPFDARLARAAYLLALLGFGTLSTVVAPTAWLPAALRRSSTPSIALIQMGLPLCALYGLLRCQSLATTALGGALIPHLLLAAALLALVPIAVSVLTERALPGLAALAGSAQIALAAAAFGLGSTEGAIAGGLALIGYSLSAIFAVPAVGAACAALHTRSTLRVGAGLHAYPLLVASAVGGLLALGGLPPTAAFLAAIAVVDAAIHAAPAASAALLVGWAAVTIGMAIQAGRMARAATLPPHRLRARYRPRLWPLALPALALLILGVHVPDGLALLLRQAATVMGDGR